MRPLSKFLRRSEGGNILPGAPLSVLCRAALPDEVQPALRMILSGGGRPADDQQVADFYSFAQQRKIELKEIWLAESAGIMLWAILPIQSPGRTVLLFSPSESAPSHIVPVVQQLIESICLGFASRDVQLAQVLLEPSDGAGRRIFESRGFRKMAELIYLHAPLRRPIPPPALPREFTVLNYSPESHALFAEAISASYQQSLDCPALNGVRHIEDIIAGHKAGGDFEPRNWFVICQHENATDKDRPIGVLLLSRLPRGDSAELVYLGLSPAARGYGLGDWMMRRAFVAAAAMGVSRLSLAVDSINSPALKLYYRFGLARMGSKIAMMRMLSTPRPPV